MNTTSRTKRFALSSRTGLVWALLLAGCQSNGQSDLVMRELRMQEDQIYAMEDYLAQYQQLLCDARAENAALKRQIAEAAGDDTLPAPQRGAEPTKRRGRSAPRGPTFQSPGRAPADSPRKSDEPEVELIDPDIPPLQGTTSMDRGRGRPGSLQSAGGNDVVVRGQSPDASAEQNDAPAKFVQIRGEVVANKSGGGPRIVVDVEPLTIAMEPTRFDGAVSLMLLEPSQKAPPHNLARWDYSAADAQTVLDEMPNHRTMRFHLELPADTPTDGKTEFWIRLMLDDGSKVLGHAQVDLSRPGRFASMVGGAGPRDGWNEQQPGGSLAAIAERNNSVLTPAFERGDLEGWTIARPDRPGQFGVDGRDTNAAWRAASGPIPAMVANAAPARPATSWNAVQQAAFVEAVPPPTPSQPPATPAVVRAAPVWTPERGDEPAEVAKTRSDGPRAVARPSWSPLR